MLSTVMGLLERVGLAKRGVPWNPWNHACRLAGAEAHVMARLVHVSDLQCIHVQSDRQSLEKAVAELGCTSAPYQPKGKLSTCGSMYYHPNEVPNLPIVSS